MAPNPPNDNQNQIISQNSKKITSRASLLYQVTSVPKKSIASAVVTNYCTCYTFFRNGRYLPKATKNNHSKEIGDRYNF